MKLEVSKSSTFVRFEKLVKSLQDQVQHFMSPMAMPFCDSDCKFDGVLWCLPGPEAAVWELLHPGGRGRWSDCAGRLHHQTGCGWKKKGYKIKMVVLEALCFWVYNIHMCFLFLMWKCIENELICFLNMYALFCPVKTEMWKCIDFFSLFSLWVMSLR